MSSHEERDSQSQYILPREEQKDSVPKPEIIQAEWQIVNVFSDYTEQKA